MNHTNAAFLADKLLRQCASEISEAYSDVDEMMSVVIALTSDLLAQVFYQYTAENKEASQEKLSYVMMKAIAGQIESTANIYRANIIENEIKKDDK